MPMIKTFLSIAAGATVANVISGSPFERVGGNGATVRLYAGSPNLVAADLIATGIDLTFMLGSDVVLDAAGVGIAAAGPKVPDDQVAEGAALPGDQITVKATNKNAAARTLGIILDIQNI